MGRLGRFFEFLDGARKDLEGKSEAHRRETQGQARTNKVVALQLRFE
eukprot:COSAG02_NODE_7298_length_3077_cov_81.755876_5_plen_46_part_01